MIAAYAAHYRASVHAAAKTDSLAVMAARDRMLMAAQKRLEAAVKMWRLIGDKRAGPRPAPVVRLYEPRRRSPARRPSARARRHATLRPDTDGP